MKVDLSDVTFLILVRLDTIQRLENILIVIEQLHRHFKTNIYVREATHYKNNILSSMLHHRTKYEYVEDKDIVLYKTKHFNQMVTSTYTTYIAIWDTDIAVDKSTIIDCIHQLRSKVYDVAYPYDGQCYDVSSVIKPLYFSKRDIRILFRHKEKMNLLSPDMLVGGAVLLNREKYVSAGGENEKHYGWSNDDYDRFYRFNILKYAIYRANKPLFHLSHPRKNNSNFVNTQMKGKSYALCYQIKNSSKEELEEDIKENYSTPTSLAPLPLIKY